MDENRVTLKIWLMGGAEPLLIDVPRADASELQRTIMNELAEPNPAGSITFGTGTLVRFAAIAACKIVDPTGSWVMRD